MNIETLNLQTAQLALVQMLDPSESTCTHRHCKEYHSLLSIPYKLGLWRVVPIRTIFNKIVLWDHPIDGHEGEYLINWVFNWIMRHDFGIN
jgi:hypothetical protein